MKRRVYIAGPISKGDMLHNLRQADAAFFRLLRAGIAPMNPMWSVFAGSATRPVAPDGPVCSTADVLPNGTTHADWMGVDLPWVEAAHAVLRLPGESVGADAEVRHAVRHNIPVYHDIDDLIRCHGAVPDQHVDAM